MVEVERKFNPEMKRIADLLKVLREVREAELKMMPNYTGHIQWLIDALEKNDVERARHVAINQADKIGEMNVRRAIVDGLFHEGGAPWANY